MIPSRNKMSFFEGVNVLVIHANLSLMVTVARDKLSV